LCICYKVYLLPYLLNVEPITHKILTYRYNI